MSTYKSFYEFVGSTIVTGTTSTSQYLICEINDQQVGVPVFQFSSSLPDLDFMGLQGIDVHVKNGTLISNVTSYGAGVALTVNSSGTCFPLYKITQNASIDPGIIFETPTIVSNLTSVGSYAAVRIGSSNYAIPMYDFGTTYPFTNTVITSTASIETALSKWKVKDVGVDDPSTNLNNKIRTYQHLINRIKYQLGAPYINIEVCDDTQIVDFIDHAMEWYTKYAGYTEEYLVFDSRLYTEPGLQIDKLFSVTANMKTTIKSVSASWDYDLGDYRKVIGVFSAEQGSTTGINELFTLEQAMAQQTYFSYMLGNVGFDLITWEVLKGWLDTREKVLAQTIYVDFDNRNQILRLIPAPYTGQRYWGVIGCWIEKPIRDLIMERWIMQYSLALTKIAIGNIRGKYQNIQLFGGGTINYNDLLSQGLEEKKALEEEILTTFGEVTPPRFWIG